MKLSNNRSEISNIIQRLAKELVVNASFIEKDWYAMHIMGTLSKLEHPNLELIFSGGTSLSKGFGLIQRFSEDIDFKINMPEKPPGRSQRSTFRKLVLEQLQQNQEEWQLDLDNLQIGNGSKFFKVPILYSAQFPSSSLRPHIQLEVTFDRPAIATQNRPLQSFVGKVLKQAPEAASFPCVSPIETAANKISALTWRVLSRDRSSSKDDATLIRHLHDLAALEEIINSSPQFNDLALDSMSQDMNRAEFEQSSQPPRHRLQALIQTLSSDAAYEHEYEEFVANMSYASEDSQFTFTQSLEALSRIVTAIGINTETQDAPIQRSDNEAQEQNLTAEMKKEATNFLDTYLGVTIKTLIPKMEVAGSVVTHEDGRKSFESSAFSWNLDPDGKVNITRLSDGQEITPQSATPLEMNAIRDFIIKVHKQYLGEIQNTQDIGDTAQKSQKPPRKPKL